MPKILGTIKFLYKNFILRIKMYKKCSNKIAITKITKIQNQLKLQIRKWLGHFLIINNYNANKLRFTQKLILSVVNLGKYVMSKITKTVN